MSDMTYADSYRDIDFRKHPEKYRIGRGEQGVMMAEPYKSEILPYWKFATVQKATESSEKITDLFYSYMESDDFVGMDMARKFLQMGFTRARRYANHADGNKYNENGAVKPQAEDWKTSEKAQAAQIFYAAYIKAKNDSKYIEMKKQHKVKEIQETKELK